MNIAALMGTSGALPNQTGQTLVSTQATDGDFKQVLQAIVAGVEFQGNQESGELSTNQNTNWLGMLLQLFDNGTADSDTLDPTGEALQTDQDETAVSLTELMTALQPLVNQNDITATADQALPTGSQETGVPGFNPNGSNEVDITTLTHLSNLLTSKMPTSTPTANTPAVLTPATPESGAANLSDTLPVMLSKIPTENSVPVEQAAAETAAGSNAKVVDNANLNGKTQGTSVPVSPSAPESLLAQQTGSNTTSTPAGTNFSQLLNNVPTSGTATTDTTSTPASTTTANNSANILSATNQPALQTQAEPQNVETTKTPTQTSDSPVSVADTATTSVQEVSLGKAATSAAPELPKIPALHQIVESVKMISQQGQTQVRLQLHPEALGQVLVQLNIIDGDVSVRMLAETVQAQALIQEHLPQLKAAFNAQGLQAQDIQIDLGNHASSFDTPGRHPEDSQFKEPGYRQNAAFTQDDSTPLTPQGPTPGPLGHLYSIDYHA